MIYTCSVIPFHDFVIVRTIDNPNKVTPGGIIIPETAEKQPLAQVIGFGPGCTGLPQTSPIGILKVGDIVILQRYVGTKVDINGQICMLVKWYDVQAKVIYRDADGNEFNPELPSDFFDTSRVTDKKSTLVEL